MNEYNASAAREDRATLGSAVSTLMPAYSLCWRLKSDKSPYNLALKLFPFYVRFSLGFFIVISRMICAGAVEYRSKCQV